MTYTHMQKFKVSGQSVPKIEWKQTDGRTDGRTNGGDCITSHANTVGNYLRAKELNILLLSSLLWNTMDSQMIRGHSDEADKLAKRAPC